MLSARPGRIEEIVESQLPRPRSADSVGTPEYNELTGQLWKLLAMDARASAMTA